MSATSGDYIDPSGFLITLRGTTSYEYAQLVTKKLAQGWRVADETVAPPPVKNEQLVALGPVEEKRDTGVIITMPSAAEREAAFLELLAEHGE